MIIDEDVYLEHFGVKGMRWGVRRQKALEAHRKKTANVNKKKFHRNVKIAAAGVAIAVGSGYVARSMARNRHVKINSINTSSKTFKQLLKEFHPYSESLPHTPTYGSIPINKLPKNTKLTALDSIRVKRILYASTQRQNRNSINLVDYRRSLGLADRPRFPA